MTVPATLPRRPTDTPQGWIGRLAREVAAGQIDGDEAMRRLDARATRLDRKTASWMRHRFRYMVENAMPPDVPAVAAECVLKVEAALAAGSWCGLQPFCPFWITKTRNAGTRSLFARLYFFALALGWNGRDFEMAQGMAARLFGCGSCGWIAEFLRKAARIGFLLVVSQGRAHRHGVRGRGTVYKLARPVRVDDEATERLYGLLAERLPCLAGRM